jgi:hypothetical protein
VRRYEIAAEELVFDELLMINALGKREEES